MSKLLIDQQDAHSRTDLAERPQIAAVRIVLGGRVQGLGVRPAIARLARQLRLAGSVGNCSDGVLIHVEGSAYAVAAFRRLVNQHLPAGARLESKSEQPSAPVGATEFLIESRAADNRLAARLPVDVAVCATCLAEVNDADNRRYGYAFATCAECGPRYSLIDAMPYDRQATRMSVFTPCERCNREHAGESDRRFYAETNSCPACGPRLWLRRDDGQILARGEDAVPAAVAMLARGCIVAVRGVGGYQLLVDARSAAAVRELRRRKQRLGKPLAVMVANLEAAEQLAILNDQERRTLASAANSIVILKSRCALSVAAEVTAGFNTIGLMLPTTPLHDQLVRGLDAPLVVTSGNIEGDPLAFDAEAAAGELRRVADLWLDHDRPIARPIDDSVVRIVAGRAMTVRLARGLAPLPLNLSTRPMLALGGHQKAAIALSNGAQCILGPHVGDLETEAARARFLEHIQSMCQLYDVTPELLVCDQHPDYFATRWATEQGVPAMTVQHHHAHVAAGMLENGWLDRQVLGVAWDGTGYGADGSIWGGEFLLASATDFRRAACLRPFFLPGGELVVREPWRAAVSLVYQALGPEQAAGLRFNGVAPAVVEQVVRLLGKSRTGAVTSSAGRLFDGVAALALDISSSQFEGHPAMLLEGICEPDCDGEYPLPIAPGAPAELDWRPLIGRVLADRRAGVSPGTIAMRFHRSLAAGIAATAARFSELPVVLCGGCFQNKVLTELVVERIDGARPVATPGVIPCNDGGLAAGQLAIAASRIARGG